MAPRGAGCRQALADRISENDTPFSWTSSQAWRLTFLDTSPSRVGSRAVALPGIARPPGRGGKDNSQALSYGAGWQAKLDSGRAPNKQMKVNKPCNPVITPLSPGFVLRKGRGGAPGSLLEHSPRGWCQVPAGEEVKGEPKWQHCAQPLPGHILTRS